MNFAKQDTHTHEITTTPIINQSLDFYRKPLRKKTVQAIGSKDHGRPWELDSGQIPAMGFTGGEGQGEGEHEGSSGYTLVVLGELEVAVGGLSTRARDGGRGELRRRRSGVRGKEGPSWEGAVGAVGGEGATNLGEKRAEEAIPRWAEARRRKGGAAVLGARAGPEAALYRQMGREEEGESEQCFDFEPLWGMTRGSRWSAEVPAGGAGNTAGGVALGQGASRGG
jgi:hypothetical protein